MPQKKSINENSAKKLSNKSSKARNESSFSELSIQKKVNNTNEANFSVITKTTKPKVVIQSENIKDNYMSHYNVSNHKIIKQAFFVVMCIIILITFFLSLKTCNMVADLSQNLLN